MSAIRVRRNLAANYAGRLWYAAMGVLFVPVYIRLLGIEAWGLVGFYVTLLGLLPLLDLGLKTTLNRELARLSAGDGSGDNAADLVRTLEVVYWSGAALLCLVLLGAAGPIAAHWINAKSLSHAVVHQAVGLMGVTVALQFPFDLYAGGLLGLHRQVQLNCLTIVTSTLRGLGVIAALELISPTIRTYFTFQACVALVQTGACAVMLWRSLPPRTRRPRFVRRELARIRRFAAGLTGIGVTSVVLTQMDNIVLIRLVPLPIFGYYTLAKTVAINLNMLVSPVYDALFPTFSRLVALKDSAALRTLYHRSCQFMSAMIIPAALVMILFSRQLMWAWTGDPVKVAHTYLLISLLAAGSALNGLMTLPYALQLANAWTRLALVSNLVAAAILLPCLVFLSERYGVVGAAVVWPVLNGAYVLVDVQIMHSRLLRGEQVRWYLDDLVRPFVAALLVALPMHALAPAVHSRMAALVLLASTWALSTTAALLAAPALRNRVLSLLPTPRTAAAGDDGTSGTADVAAVRTAPLVDRGGSQFGQTLYPSAKPAVPQQPPITCLIPTYRRPRLLARAILSALHQDYPALTVRVFDNASGDETESVVRALQAGNSRLDYVRHPENIGMQANFRAAQQSVDTPYYSLLSDDDVLLPGFYTRAAQKLERSPGALFAAGLTFEVTPAGDVISDAPLALPDACYEPPSGLLALLRHGHPLSTGVLFRRETLEVVGLIDPNMVAADVDLYYRAAAVAPFLVFHHPCGLFVAHEGSTTADGSYRIVYPAFLEIARRIEEDPRVSAAVREPARDSIRADLARRLWERGLYCVLTRRGAEAREIAPILRCELNSRRRAYILSSAESLSRLAGGLPLLRAAHGVVRRHRPSRTARLDSGAAGIPRSFAQYLALPDALCDEDSPVQARG